MMMRTAGCVVALIAVAMMATSANGAGMAVSKAYETDLLSVSSFAVLDTRAHLAYLSAKSYATKNNKAEDVKRAGARCDAIRRTAQETCANQFCECQEGSDCSTLELSVFLETEPFALRTGKDKCAPAKIHASCHKVVGQAFKECREHFLQQKQRPSVEELLQVKDVKTFMRLAGQFSPDGHTHIFDMDMNRKLEETKMLQTGNDTAAPADVTEDMGPEPTASEVSYHHYEDATDSFRAANDAERTVESDETELEHEHPDFAKSKAHRDLESAVAKCDELKLLTEHHCHVEMCDYHHACGTDADVTACNAGEKQWELQEANKEKNFKIQARMQAINEAHDEMMEKHGGEMTEKSAAAHEAWLNSAPQRAARAAEDAEIKEKATHTVNQWFDNDDWSLPADNMYHAVATAAGGHRRLLQADTPGAIIVSSAEQIKKLQEEKAAADAHAKAVSDLLNSPRCVAMVDAAYSNCSLITQHAYDICTHLLNEADEEFLAAMAPPPPAPVNASAPAAEPVIAEPVPTIAEPTSDDATAAEEPAAEEPVVVEGNTTADAIVPAATEAVEAEPSPVGEGPATEPVVSDEVTSYTHEVETASSLKAAHEAIVSDDPDFAAATAAAASAEESAEVSAEDTEKTTTDDVAGADAETLPPTDDASTDLAAPPPALIQTTRKSTDLYKEEVALYDAVLPEN